MLRTILPFLLLLTSSAFAQNSLLQCGPMVGFAETDRVLLWVQTKIPAKVQFKYWEKGDSSRYWFTQADSTLEANGFTVKEIAGHLLPGSVYNYVLYLNDEKVSIDHLLQFRAKHVQAVDTFKVALGSCALYSESPEVNRIFTSILDKKPELMLWLGDNVYLDRSECNSKESIVNAYTRSMSRREIQPLLGSVHNYAVWDDHDFGPDNSDSTFCNKEISKEVFELFWGNPFFGINGKGITTALNFPDIDFFLMDNRYMRSPNRPTTRSKSYLGEQQVQWLFEQLSKSQATYKLIAIGNQILPAGLIAGESYGKYKKELKSILKKIKEQKIEGVFFITGDRHFSELTKKKRRKCYPLYDLTVSPLTSTPITKEFNINLRRVKGTYVGERNFSVLEFYKDDCNAKQMKINLYNSQGGLIWQKTIAAGELQAK